MNQTNEIIKIADIHVNWIQQALLHIHSLFPLDEKKVVALNETDFLYLELLINRFGKLHDIMGKKLIDIYLDAYQENNDELSLLDKLNKLEKLGVIDSADSWKEMRNVRNHVSHEYPDAPQLTAAYLNHLYDLTPSLLQFYEKIKQRLVQ